MLVSRKQREHRRDDSAQTSSRGLRKNWRTQMRFMRAHTQHPQSRRSQGGSLLRTVPPSARNLEDETLGRYEAQAIASRAVASDPYAAWLERREAERSRQERPEIRWVYRYPRPTGNGGPERGGTREAPADRGPVSPEDGLVGVA
jgi:hypothetical protein